MGGWSLRSLEAPSNPRDHQRSARGATSQPSQLQSYHAILLKSVTLLSLSLHSSPIKAVVILQVRQEILISSTMQEVSRDWVMVVTAETGGSRQSLFLLYILSHRLKTNTEIE